MTEGPLQVNLLKEMDQNLQIEMMALNPRIKNSIHPKGHQNQGMTEGPLQVNLLKEMDQNLLNHLL
jgi:hypothetical protein